MLSGTVLGKRYRIGERIGGGGMAVVYKADDIMLGRTVAVKVLRSQFAGDDEFIRRFRREAQSVASLSHPGIVSIYDVGEDQGLHYIVMELVEGETLKQLIDREAPLPPAQVATIGMQVLDAMEAAHQRRIVHRDIKPHNILVTRDGRIKVTDFGIARATGMDTQTNTGSIMGSAHYFSPEQARGIGVGEKSDLYSVGVVLYEMATGTVPFQGESPISVALKHVQDEVTPAGRLNAQVPVELDEIILRAMEKEPDDRFESAGQMRGALARFKEDLVAGRTHQGVGEFPTQDLRALRNAAVATASAAKKDGRQAHDNGQKGGRRKAPIGLIVGILSVVLLLGVAILGYIQITKWWDVPTVSVPNVVNSTIVDAENKLTGAGLQSKVIGSQEDPTKVPGTVLVQIPEANAMIKQGQPVKLIISSGAKMSTVPNVVGMKQADAYQALQTAGLQVGETKTQSDSRQPEGAVISQSQAPNSQVVANTKVDLVVSTGPLRIDVRGKSLAEATKYLVDQGLLVNPTLAPSPQPKDTVISQNPLLADNVRVGDTINLTVSSGPSGPAPGPGTSDSGGSGGPTPTGPTQNPDGSKTITVNIEVRAQTGNPKVTVVLVDDLGQTTLFDAPRPAGTTFPLTFNYRSSKGPATYKVSIGGLPMYSEPLP